MLIDTSVTVAYKCFSCGSFKFANISLFELLHKTYFNLKCNCNGSGAAIRRENNKDYKIKIPCIGCGNEHIFTLGRKELLGGDVNVFYCPQTGVQQCFIGSDEDVRKRIDRVEKEFDEIINTFGYDNYFKNTQVMFDVLNRVHDIAEQENLLCECGNTDIELSLLPDKVYLKCKKCVAYRIINASSNNDLKDILLRNQILLSKDVSEYVIWENK